MISSAEAVWRLLGFDRYFLQRFDKEGTDLSFYNRRGSGKFDLLECDLAQLAIPSGGLHEVLLRPRVHGGSPHLLDFYLNRPAKAEMNSPFVEFFRRYHVTPASSKVDVSERVATKDSEMRVGHLRYNIWRLRTPRVFHLNVESFTADELRSNVMRWMRAALTNQVFRHQMPNVTDMRGVGAEKNETALRDMLAEEAQRGKNAVHILSSVWCPSFSDRAKCLALAWLAQEGMLSTAEVRQRFVDSLGADGHDTSSATRLLREAMDDDKSKAMSFFHHVRRRTDAAAEQHKMQAEKALIDNVPAQRQLCDDIVDHASSVDPENVMIVDSQAGSGKTTVFRAAGRIAAHSGKNVLYLGMSAAAALQFRGGQVLHQAINLSFDVSEGFRLTSFKKKMLEDCDLLFLDEAFLGQKSWIEALHCAFCEARRAPSEGPRSRIFAGVRAVVGGDRGQMIPIVRLDDTLDEEADAVGSMLEAHVDRFLEKFGVKTRSLGIRESPRFEEPEWAEELVSFRDGSKTELDLQDFPQMRASESKAEIARMLLWDEAILLCSRHRSIREWNDTVIDLPADEWNSAVGTAAVRRTYNATETYEEVEIYGDISFGSLGRNIAPQKLSLRRGGLVKFTARYGCSTKGRMARVLHLGVDVIEVLPVDGGPSVSVSRVACRTSIHGFRVARFQFPLIAGHAHTWMSVQGETVRRPKKLIIDLSDDVPFSHGQLYVLLSRATSKTQIMFLLPDGSDLKKVGNVQIDWSACGDWDDEAMDLHDPADILH